MLDHGGLSLFAHVSSQSTLVKDSRLFGMQPNVSVRLHRHREEPRECSWRNRLSSVREVPVLWNYYDLNVCKLLAHVSVFNCASAYVTAHMGRQLNSGECRIKHRLACIVQKIAEWRFCGSRDRRRPGCCQGYSCDPKQILAPRVSRTAKSGRS
jgi:hypothetical protein